MWRDQAHGSWIPTDDELQTAHEQRLEKLLIEKVNDLLGSVYVHDQRWVAAVLTELGHTQEEINQIWVGELILTDDDT